MSGRRRRTLDRLDLDAPPRPRPATVADRRAYVDALDATLRALQRVRATAPDRTLAGRAGRLTVEVDNLRAEAWSRLRLAELADAAGLPGLARDASLDP